MFTPHQIVPIFAIMAVGLLIAQNIVSPRVLGSVVGLNPPAALATLFVAWLDRVRPTPAIPPPAVQAHPTAPVRAD